jgi:hypothetical protein
MMIAMVLLINTFTVKKLSRDIEIMYVGRHGIDLHFGVYNMFLLVAGLEF